MNALDEQVMDFVVEFTGYDRGCLTEESTIYGDVGLDGEDGCEFIRDFSEKFGVDLAAFRAGDYFGPEGLPIYAPLAFVWWLVSWPFRRRQSPEVAAGLRPVRIRDLITVAKIGKWVL